MSALSLSSPISPLQAQQNALLQALFAPSRQTGDGENPFAHPQAQRGLKAYQANGHTMAENALRAAYPVTDMLLGTDNFQALAHALWHSQPPMRGDLAQWGEAFPQALAQNGQLQTLPYLADVARAEWALHQAAFAADAEPDAASFALLSGEDFSAITLVFAPGIQTVRSAFPIVSLLKAHQSEPPLLEEAAQALRQGAGEIALVWRHGWQPRLDKCSPAAAALIEAIVGGASLDSALDAAWPDEESAPDDLGFSDWLTTAVTSGLLIGVCRLGGCAAEGTSAATREKPVSCGTTFCAQGPTLGLNVAPNDPRFSCVSLRCLLPRSLLACEPLAGASE